MMEQTLIHVPTKLFAAAESSHFEGRLDTLLITSGPDTYSFKGPLSWQVEMTNTGGALLVCGTVEGQAVTACARCAENFERSLIGEIEGYFLIDGENAPDDLDEDDFEVLPANKDIDLYPLIRAALMLEFPLIPLCAEDCRGLCPFCGKNLNEGPCDCEQSQHQPNGAELNPFFALKDFPFKEN